MVQRPWPFSRTIQLAPIPNVIGMKKSIESNTVASVLETCCTLGSSLSTMPRMGPGKEDDNSDRGVKFLVTRRNKLGSNVLHRLLHQMLDACPLDPGFGRRGFVSGLLVGVFWHGGTKDNRAAFKRKLNAGGMQLWKGTALSLLLHDGALAASRALQGWRASEHCISKLSCHWLGGLACDKWR